MRLTSYTDYSLRVLIYLGLQSDRRVKVSEISERFHISRNHLVKVINNLGRGGFIRSHRGKGGGITLARVPEKINLGQVVRFTEGSLQVVECFRSGNACVITGACTLADVLREACSSFLKVLDRHTLADLLIKRTSLMRRLVSQPGPRHRTIDSRRIFQTPM
jgi:Rrf2 family transcriptional regulator, nitric oxide-sensitive transcriptional repressor